jgi:hypothetical protein
MPCFGGAVFGHLGPRGETHPWGHSRLFSEGLSERPNRRQAAALTVGHLRRSRLHAVLVASPGPSLQHGGSRRFTECAHTAAFVSDDVE